METYLKNKGAALVELVMCMAFLFFLFVAIMFFGWAMINQQHVKEAARYVSWRTVYNESITHNTDDPYNPNGPNNAIEATDANDFTPINSDTLNILFFRGEAVGLSINFYDADHTEFEEWIDAANAESSYAGNFSDQLLLNPPAGYNHFHHAEGADVDAIFRSEIEAFNKYGGAMHSTHIRDGVEWRRRQADIRHVTRIQFLQSLDDQLRNIPDPGKNMGQMIRNLYYHGW